MTIISSKIALAIMESSNAVPTIASHLKTIIKDVKAYAEVEKANLESQGKKFLGIMYSNSLFDDATDNIFYSVHVGETTDGKDFYAEVRFVHNATQLYTGLIVQPAAVQQAGSTTGEYAYACINNITFPRHLTHLLLQSLTKLEGELAVEYTALADVAILETTRLSFR